jgi:hypothetical protein
MDKSLLELVDKNSTISAPRPKGFGITKAEYAKERGLTGNVALRMLDELEEIGILKSQLMREDGKRVRVFFKANKK